MTKVEICENKKHTVRFGNLKKGDYFWYDELLCIKIGYSDIDYNSVSLGSGNFHYFEDYDDILPINNISICVKD